MSQLNTALILSCYLPSCFGPSWWFSPKQLVLYIKHKRIIYYLGDFWRG